MATSDVVSAAVNRASLRGIPEVMRSRRRADPSITGFVSAQIADIGRTEAGRAAFDLELDSKGWCPPQGALSCPRFDEVVVGGGLHAAIYAATAYNMTGKRVAVFEKERLGGIMAVTAGPSFRLNSRNRGGELGVPGSGAALNVIPGGVIQPADLNGAEYQTNADFAFAIRATLASYANAYRTRVTRIEKRLPSDEPQMKYFIAGPMIAQTNRVILAVGPGEPVELPGADTACDFARVMRLAADEAVPFENWGEVAVVGDGDAACCAIEAMVGQGPCDIGPASLSTIRRITWHGQKCLYKDEFEEARSRYAGLGRFFPRRNEPDYSSLIDPIPERVGSAKLGSNGWRLFDTKGRPLPRVYDRLVVCAGVTNTVNDLIMPNVDESLTESEWFRYPLRDDLVYDSEGVAIARKVYGAEIYKVGPCADLPVTKRERRAVPVLDRIPSNSAACFRYAGPTQRLAEMLHG